MSIAIHCWWLTSKILLISSDLHCLCVRARVPYRLLVYLAHRNTMFCEPFSYMFEGQALLIFLNLIQIIVILSVPRLWVCAATWPLLISDPIIPIAFRENSKIIICPAVIPSLWNDEGISLISLPLCRECLLGLPKHHG